MAAGGGGSWKVAYADFVTAMMALFMVLWIMNQDQEVRGSVEEFFKNPWKSPLSDSTGIIPIENADVVTSRKANFENPSVVPLESVRRINEDLVRVFLQQPEYRDHKSLHVELTDEGLLINFLDKPNLPIFKEDSAEFTEYGAWVFSTVAWEVARYAGTEIELEGHTEEGYKSSRPEADAWSISADRAISARKRLVSNGVKESQVRKVAGYAGTQPLKNRDPKDETNRRVTIMIRAGKEN